MTNSIGLWPALWRKSLRIWQPTSRKQCLKYHKATASISPLTSNLWFCSALLLLRVWLSDALRPVDCTFLFTLKPTAIRQNLPSFGCPRLLWCLLRFVVHTHTCFNLQNFSLAFLWDTVLHFLYIHFCVFVLGWLLFGFRRFTFLATCWMNVSLFPFPSFCSFHFLHFKIYFDMFPPFLFWFSCA